MITPEPQGPSKIQVVVVIGVIVFAALALWTALDDPATGGLVLALAGAYAYLVYRRRQRNLRDAPPRRDPNGPT